MKKLLMVLGLVAMTALSACGKMSVTEPLPDSGYPHTYPRY